MNAAWSLFVCVSIQQTNHVITFNILRGIKLVIYLEVYYIWWMQPFQKSNKNIPRVITGALYRVRRVIRIQ